MGPQSPPLFDVAPKSARAALGAQVGSGYQGGVRSRDKRNDENEEARERASPTPPLHRVPNSALGKLLRSPGRPPPYLNDMEGFFGTSLSGVQTHLGAADALDGVGKAATSGETIAFADPRPAPEVVAHELTHVLQNRASGDDPAKAEHEARSASDAFEAGAAEVGPVTAGVGSSVMAFDPLGIIDRVGDALDIRPGEARLDALEELADFRSKTFAPALDYRPSSGRGLFDAAFDPASGQMVITLKLAYNFVSGDPARVAPGYRPTEFDWQSLFGWDYEADMWKTRLASQISAAWSGAFTFRSTKPHWTAMNVNVRVEVVEDDADPHYTVTVEKYPEDAALVGSAVAIPSGSTSTADFDVNDLRPEQKQDWANVSMMVPFAPGSSTLNAAGRAALTPVITQLTGDPTTRVELTGRASAVHASGVSAADGAIANMDLARARTAAVAAELAGGGVSSSRILIRNQGEAGAGAGNEWCRVDAQVGSQEMQVAATHEAGHMFGSADEYDNAANPPGSPVAPSYQGMITAQTGDTVTRVDSSNIMSLGSSVQRWNYAPFLEALKKITSMSDWSV